MNRVRLTIREACKGRGIENGYQLQKLAGLSPAQAARLFRNEAKSISFATLERLMAVLGVPLAALITADAGDTQTKGRKKKTQ